MISSLNTSLLIMVIPILITFLALLSPSSCGPSLVSSTKQTSSHESYQLPPLPSDVEEALEYSQLGRNSPALVIRTWKEFIKRAPFWAESWTDRVKSKLNQVIASKNNSILLTKECQTSLQNTLQSINNLDEWAIKRKFHTCFTSS